MCGHDSEGGRLCHDHKVGGTGGDGVLLLREGDVFSAAAVLSQCTKSVVDVALYTIDCHGAEGASSV